jgi:magnesium chelatase accessory protein
LIAGTGSRIDERGLELYARLLGRPEHVSGALAMMASWDLAPLIDRLPRLEVPVDLLVGSEDGAVPPDTSYRLAEKCPTFNVRVFDGLGHLMHEERPELFADAILEIAAQSSSP